MVKKIILFLIAFSIIGCAKRGTPDGGPKDEDPPIFVRSQPANNSSNFDSENIRIYFDEYIKLEKINSQLIVSPPIEKSLYSIFPQSGASKFIDIDLKDSLKKNSTYSFNFGQALVDNNEGNPLPFFKYVFSTGNYIDSLNISGNIKDSYNRDTDEFITAMLYPIDSLYNDSIIYNGRPLYVSNTLDSTNFKFTNLKKGVYNLIAIKDYNNNFRYDPLTEKIAFNKTPITIPSDSLFNLNIFQESPEFKIFKPFQNDENKINFGFQGDTENLDVKIENGNNLNSVVTFDKEKDTLYVWLENSNYDSLNFEINNKDYEKSYVFKFQKKELGKDSLQLKQQSQILELSDKLSLESTTPLININNEKIEVYDRDSIPISFEVILENYTNLILDFEVLPNDIYYVHITPNAVIDIFQKTTDSLNFSFKTKKISEYGKIFFNPIQKNYPLIVDLINTKDEVVDSQYLASASDNCVFENIIPGEYNIRVVEDKNENKKRDTGNFLGKIQPEKIYFNNEIIKVRSNWIIRESF
tara:strand:- start:25393 stop:26970 length:1578 start_codon:yes stop_codon:yes gene_type:complete